MLFVAGRKLKSLVGPSWRLHRFQFPTTFATAPVFYAVSVCAIITLSEFSGVLAMRVGIRAVLAVACLYYNATALLAQSSNEDIPAEPPAQINRMPLMGSLSELGLVLIAHRFGNTDVARVINLTVLRGARKSAMTAIIEDLIGRPTLFCTRVLEIFRTSNTIKSQLSSMRKKWMNTYSDIHARLASPLR